MFSRGSTTYGQYPVARGGVSLAAVLTGVVVAFGAMLLFGALIGGILTSLGMADGVSSGEAVEAGVATGLALVVAQLLAYMWGGYTAGRMGRGAGVAHGLLVPLLAILVALGVGALVTALGTTANLNLPFTENRLPVDSDFLVDFGLGIGIASLVAMFIGGVIGGALGHRWHTKLERTAYESDVVAAYDTDDDTHATHPGVAAVDLQDGSVPARRTSLDPETASGDTTTVGTGTATGYGPSDYGRDRPGSTTGR